MSEFLRTEHRTARKSYRCNWCGERVEIGERCLVLAGIGEEGDFINARMHLECETAWRQFFSERRGEDSYDAEEMQRGSIEPRDP